MAKFIKETVEEFKRVEWPSRRQAIRLTIYVVGVSLFVSLFVSLLDYLFKQGLTWIITK